MLEFKWRRMCVTVVENIYSAYSEYSNQPNVNIANVNELNVDSGVAQII